MSRKKRNGKKATKRGTRTVTSPAHSTGSASSAGGAALAARIEPEEAVGTILEAIAPTLFQGAGDTLPQPSEPPELVSGTFATHAPVSATSVREAQGELRDDDVEPPTPRVFEQRESLRIALEIEIGLVTDSHFFCGLSGDVSEGGVFVQTYRDLPVGREVALDFELPGGHISTHGKVCWHRSPSENAPPGLGIAFDHLPDEARSIIHAFCEAREPLYYDVEHA